MKDLLVQLTDDEYEAIRRVALQRGTTATRMAQARVRALAASCWRTVGEPSGLPAAILRLQRQGKTVPEIAAALDQPNNKIRYELDKLGLKAARSSTAPPRGPNT